MSSSEKHATMSQGPLADALAYQFTALGSLDMAFNKDTCFTFWRGRHARPSPHAMIHVAQPFDSPVKLGGTVSATLRRNGHLIHKAYFVMKLPAIYAVRPGDSPCGLDYPTPENRANCRGGYHEDDYFIQRGDECDGYENDCRNDPDSLEWKRKVGKDQWLRESRGGYYSDCRSELINAKLSTYEEYTEDCDCWVHYVDSIGFAVLKHMQLMIGPYRVDELWGEFLFCWEVLTGRAGKRLREMVGKYKSKSELLLAAQTEQLIAVPLPWFFTHSPGDALPMVSIASNAIRMEFALEKMERLIIYSEPGLEVRKAIDDSCLHPSDFEAYLDIHYVHLDIPERKKFAEATFDQLITQVSRRRIVTENQSEFKLPIHVNNTVKDMIWFVRREENVKLNRTFDFSGLDCDEPIQYIELETNGDIRFGYRHASFYRTVIPHEFYRNIPRKDRLEFVYAYTFSLFPMESHPSGQYNLSKLHTVYMNVTLQPGLEKEKVEFVLFIRQLNTIRYWRGIAGPLRAK